MTNQEIIPYVDKFCKLFFIPKTTGTDRLYIHSSEIKEYHLIAYIKGITISTTQPSISAYVISGFPGQTKGVLHKIYLNEITRIKIINGCITRASRLLKDEEQL